MNLNLKPFVITRTAALTFCLTSSVVVYAQERVTDVGPKSLVTPRKAGSPEWGTANTSVLTVPAFAFNSMDSSPQFNTGPYNRFSPSGAEVEAPVFLPAGAVISEIELEGCDTDPGAAVVFELFYVVPSGGNVPLSPLGSTGIASTPGCGFFPLAVPPHTVDNAINTYYVAVSSGSTPATNYTAVRVRYQLQVSPAPSVATFSDVPTSHPYFKFVEALAAAGITGGCGGGKFCPDTPLTRGQMAVFLSVALGLYWPN